jgi:2-octaprenyl-6-methoxyphenol hydroxylase
MMAAKPVHSASTRETADADAAIVGGGMVGLALAAALGSAGIRIAVVDREPPAELTAPAFDGRVSAIAMASQRLLDTVGVWRHVAEAQPILDIRVAEGDSPLFVHYDHREVGDQPFGHMVENRLLRLALLARLKELPNVRLIAPIGVKGMEAGPGLARLGLSDGQTLRAPLVVSAEGRRSLLREQAGIACVAWDYEQFGIVVTVGHEHDHRGVAIERFLPAGPFAMLPMCGRRSSLVWTEPSERAGPLLKLPAAEFAAEMGRRFGDHLGRLEIQGPRWSYPLSLHLAERYVDRRLALVGDSAHGIHPIAGQGLNLGFRDVAALAEVVVDAMRLGLDAGAGEVLERYQRWRRVDSLVLAATTDGLNRLFSNDIAPLKLARNLGLGAVNRIGPLKRFFMRHAMGTVGTLPRLLQGAAL